MLLLPRGTENRIKVGSFTEKMGNKQWKLRLSQLMVLHFAFASCLCTDKFEPDQGSGGDALPAPVEKNPQRPWVPKCCNLTKGYVFENKSVCVETTDEFLPDFEDRPDYSETAKPLPAKTRYEYYIGDPCSDGKYLLDSLADPEDKYFVYTNGTLLYSDRLHGKEEFCLETVNGSIRAFVCFGTGTSPHGSNVTYIVYAVCLLISIPFLLATALPYLCVESFRDLRGKSLSCHVLCLATGYLVLATVQLCSDYLDEALCIASGFIIQFFFVASFFWLNIICFDTWRCMKDDFRHTYRPKKALSEKVIFYIYSVYGWYGPLMLSIVTLIMDLEPAIPEWYLKPNFGLRSCWFYSDDAALPYFYGPVAIIIFINIVFFVMSARKIYLEKRREQRIALGGNPEEEIGEISLTIRLYTKTLQECIYLFCIMGINWAAEVVSWAAGGSRAIWFVTDVFNALQGVMIFYLFVLRPISVRNEVKRRMCVIWKKIFTRNRHREGEKKRNSRRWKANFNHEMERSCNDDENEKFLITATGAAATTAV